MAIKQVSKSTGGAKGIAAKRPAVKRASADRPSPAKREPGRGEPAKRDPQPATPAKKDPPAKAPASKEPPKRAAAGRVVAKSARRGLAKAASAGRAAAKATSASRGVASRSVGKQAAFMDPADEPSMAIESELAETGGVKKSGNRTVGKSMARKSAGGEPITTRATIDPVAKKTNVRKTGANKAGANTGDSQRSREPAPVLPENIALVLQGGGALGAYQAGVYQGMFEAGIAPNWIAGISIGAFNTAIIAGNPPEKRMQALREFWETISQPSVFPATTLGQEARLQGIDETSRAWLDTWEAWRAIIEGQRGFYQPRLWLGQDPFSPPGPAAASLYDTSPMIATLERMVDFDRLNDGGIRVSVGAVNVRTGNLEYFDNTQMRLDARHILASGALPPAFPAIEIDGEFYWDGGLVSNTPLSHVLTSAPRRDTLVFQVDLWNARGELPQNLLDVAERQKEIQYSSRTRLITDTQRVFQHYRRLLRELLEEIPEQVRKTNPWAQHAEQLACDRRYSVIHLIYRDRARIGHFKDYQFGRVAMREHWVSGQGDITRALGHPDWLQLPQGESAFVAHDATAL